MAIIPLLPPQGFPLLMKNLYEARHHGLPRNMASPTVYYWFYQQVRNKGPWDYKQMGPQYQNFDNFNFGATGVVAGIPEAVLLRGAGWAQNRAGTSDPRWGQWYWDMPYGDDPRDRFWN
ncbi:polymorphic toxin type 44 domain-containing protein [Erwinia sp. E_sp_B04_7]|uniref:polymorphic toxin type 44 domain-containing protein n=1 Tax=unclassified Erwinia TaxID=2622719 RepID=UPI0030CCC182